MDKNEEILINPYTAIRLFAKTFLEFGDIVLENRRYKLTLEAWISAMFLIGIGKETRTDWWLNPVKDNSGSPDFNCYTFIRDTLRESTSKPRIKLEVFEWRKEQTETDFIEALRKIKLNKIVDPQLAIVCYIRRNTTLSSAVELNAQLKKLSPRVKDIWYLADVSKDSKTWRLTQIFPNTLAIDLDYDQILKMKEKRSFIYAYRGKSDQIEFESTGKQVLLSPEFDIKILEK